MSIKKVYATFVLPAPNGCNLKCPYCVIAHRKEAGDSRLKPENYLNFLSDILTELKIDRVAIQGYEPLLPEVWPLTKAMLVTAGRFGCETSLITNGTYLEQCANEIGGFPGLVESLTVSLDSAVAEKHDRLRQTPGSFAAALRGLRAATEHFRGNLLVNSVLFPGKHHYLSDMPKLLSQFGVREWSISPLINIGTKSSVPQSAHLKESLLLLSDKARHYGIDVYLSDELRQSVGLDLFEEFYLRTLGPEEEVFRLSPDGSCSRGVEVLHSSEGVPRWDGVETPSDFLRRIFREKSVTIKSRGKLHKLFMECVATEINQRKEVTSG